MKELTLDTLKPGNSAVVTGLLLEGEIGRRLSEMGLIKNAAVRCIQNSPLGNPVAYFVSGAVIAIRGEDAKKIIITPIHDVSNEFGKWNNRLLTHKKHQSKE